MPRTSVISAFINDNASGGTGPDGTQYYVELTIQSSQVSSDLTNFPVYVDLSDMPAAFFTNVQSDGGDIRVTKSDGATRCAVDLVSIDTTGGMGELHFLAPSVSSSINTTFRVYYNAGGSLSQPGAETTYGRNAVWSDYESVYHLNEDPSGTAPQIVDSTGNGNDGTTVGAMTNGDSVSGKLAGQGLDFDAVNDAVNTGARLQGIANAFTISAWFKRGTVGRNEILVGRDGSQDRIYQFRLDSDGGVRLIRFAGGGNVKQVATNVDYDNGFWHLAHATFDTTNGSKIYVDGINDGSDVDTTSNDDTLNEEMFLGLRDGIPQEDFYGGSLDEVRVRTSSISSAWASSEYTNQNAPSTFYVVGTQIKI